MGKPVRIPMGKPVRIPMGKPVGIQMGKSVGIPIGITIPKATLQYTQCYWTLSSTINGLSPSPDLSPFIKGGLKSGFKPFEAWPHACFLYKFALMEGLL